MTGHDVAPAQFCVGEEELPVRLRKLFAALESMVTVPPRSIWPGPRLVKVIPRFVSRFEIVRLEPCKVKLVVPLRTVKFSNGNEAKPTVAVVPLIVTTLRLLMLMAMTPLFQEPASCTALMALVDVAKLLPVTVLQPSGMPAEFKCTTKNCPALPMVPVLLPKTASVFVPTVWLPVMFPPFIEPVKLPAFTLPLIVASLLTVRLPPTVALLTMVTLSLRV